MEIYHNFDYIFFNSPSVVFDLTVYLISVLAGASVFGCTPILSGTSALSGISVHRGVLILSGASIISGALIIGGALTPLTKLGELAHHVCTHITFKRIKLESPGCSGFVINSKPDQT